MCNVVFFCVPLSLWKSGLMHEGILEGRVLGMRKELWEGRLMNEGILEGKVYA